VMGCPCRPKSHTARYVIFYNWYRGIANFTNSLSVCETKHLSFH